jgi:rSAM/selenodomain-associated transferase 2
MITVVIPTFNEAPQLPSTLSALRAQDEPVEVVVVDAGSDDETLAVAREAGARVVLSERRQRAHQLNRGAAEAHGEVLWFLHADTWVHPHAAGRILKAFEDPAVVGGGFRRWFRSASPFLLLSCGLAVLRSHGRGWYFGDQSIFVRREVFERVGGFPDLPVFEDFEFCQKLKGQGKLRCLGPAVRSSARRFAAQGALWVTLRDLWWTVRYWRGESPEALWESIRRH